ncbi:innexin inx2 [Eurytemora carolleeae]|uniref:innexin inx2 n=1 Tax=Eurytemora carolleeae TaxID=1294199 RepID=UPI000C78C98A|nr:innexin inx2 [Eurytemora carolleeae]|eukprot:XP_023329458.1 innexin inx2-like [Eurytemora affinis]
MYGVLSGLSVLLELDEVKTDNYMLRLHYVACVSILVGYSAIITVNTYAGDPIDCLTSHPQAPGLDFLDSFCYIHGTETLAWNIEGAGPKSNKSVVEMDCGSEEECGRKHSYYQWVAIVILFQAGLFYLPRYIWYGWEGGQMMNMIGTLAKQPKFFIDAEPDNCGIIELGNVLNLTSSGCERTEGLAKLYLNGLGSNRFYICKFSIIEMLSLIVAWLQYLISDGFLDGAMSKHGLSLFQDILQVESKRTDMLEWSLPIRSRCEYSQFGSAGNKITVDALCVLPNNVLHQKFFVFWGIWLVGVILYTSIHMLGRALLFFIPAFRLFVATSLWAESENKTGSQKVLKYIFQNISYSDWQILTFIHGNLATYNFMLFLEDLSYHYYQENAQERVFLKALGLVQHKTPNEKSVEKAEYLQESENPEYFI